MAEQTKSISQDLKDAVFLIPFKQNKKLDNLDYLIYHLKIRKNQGGKYNVR